jgi:hypothetical protein
MFAGVQWFDKDYNEELHHFELSIESDDERKFAKLLNKLNIDYKKEEIELEPCTGTEIFIFDLNELFNAMIIKLGD